MFLPHPRVKVNIVGSLRDREVACSASDRQSSIFESCVWRTVSSQSSHHPQEVLLAQFSLYVHKGGLKPDSFHVKQFCREFLFFRMFLTIAECLLYPEIPYDRRENLLSISQLLRDNPKHFDWFVCVYLILTGQSRQHREIVCRRQMLPYH